MAARNAHTFRHAFGPKPRMAGLVSLAVAAAALATSTPALSDVSLGVLIPLTGPGSGFGQQMRTAIDMFSEKYLDLGGKAGKLKLEVGDTRGNVPEAINLTRKLIDSGN